MESSSAVDLEDMVGRKGIITMEIKEGRDSLGEVKWNTIWGIFSKPPSVEMEPPSRLTPK